MCVSLIISILACENMEPVPPTTRDDYIEAVQGETIMIDVIKNDDSEAYLHALQVNTRPLHGTIDNPDLFQHMGIRVGNQSEDCRERKFGYKSWKPCPLIRYTSDKSFTGTDSFQYTLYNENICIKMPSPPITEFTPYCYSFAHVHINVVTATPTPTITPTFTPTATATSSSTATATNTPTGTLQPSPACPSSQPMAIVQVNSFCRSGPSMIYDKLTTFVAGTELLLSGYYQHPDGTIWWNVVWPDTSTHCWISAIVVDVCGALEIVPLLTPPPTPTPRPQQQGGNGGLACNMLAQSEAECGDGLWDCSGGLCECVCEVLCPNFTDGASCQAHSSWFCSWNGSACVGP